MSAQGLVRSVLHPKMFLLATAKAVRIDKDIVDIKTLNVDRFPSINEAKKEVRRRLLRKQYAHGDLIVRTFHTPGERMRYLKVMHKALDIRNKNS